MSDGTNDIVDCPQVILIEFLFLEEPLTLEEYSWIPFTQGRFVPSLVRWIGPNGSWEVKFYQYILAIL